VKASHLEKQFALYWRAIQGPALQPEFRFCPGRRWRFDFAHESSKVGIEIEGGVWTGGRHTRGSGYIADCEKYNQAALQGWAVIRLTRCMIDVKTLETIAVFIEKRTP
jgi:very-short-patch-repair endonuclease